CCLLLRRWHGEHSSLEVSDIDPFDGCAQGAGGQLLARWLGLERVKEPRCRDVLDWCDPRRILSQVRAHQCRGHDLGVSVAPAYSVDDISGTNATAGVGLVDLEGSLAEGDGR